jgi:acyl-CoA reductase-like NAD-dependent aldehyde dehydrogenase
VDLANTVLPADVLHVIPCGSEPGQALVANPLVAKVTFTGSTGGGIAAAKTAAQNVTPVTLELGGKNAFAVFDDADLHQAVRDAPYGLLAAVYSQDQEKAFRVARRFEAGMLQINTYYRYPLGTPFGGVKHSGYGREHSLATLQEFGQPKMTRFPSGRSRRIDTT